MISIIKYLSSFRLKYTRIESILFLLLFLFAGTNIVISLYNIFAQPPLGDENFYLQEFSRFNDKGLTALNEGISLLFILLAWILNKIIQNPLISLRLISIISTIFIVYYFFRLEGLLGLTKKFLLLGLNTLIVLIIIQGSFFQGINDPLMLMLSVAGIYYLLKYFKTDTTGYIIISALFFGLSFWVRSFSAFFLLGIGVGLSIFLIAHIRNREVFTRHIKWVGIFFTFVFFLGILPHIPALISSKEFAFENKNPGEINWSHRNWLDHINRLPSGSFFAYNRTPWEDVFKYLENNGENSIPLTIPERIRKDPKFFTDNFASNFFIRIPFLLVFYTGIPGIVFLSFVCMIKFRTLNIKVEYVVLGGIIAVLSLGLSIYIITYIESRWYLMALILSVLIALKGISDDQIKRPEILLYSQYLFLILQSLFTLTRIL